jgi:hypothetical protein
MSIMSSNSPEKGADYWSFGAVLSEAATSVFLDSTSSKASVTGTAGAKIKGHGSQKTDKEQERYIRDVEANRPICVSLSGPRRTRVLPSSKPDPMIRWDMDCKPPWTKHWDPEWSQSLSLHKIKQIAEPFIRLCNLAYKDGDVSVRFFAQGINKLYLFSSTDSTTGKVKECIFRALLPLNPWFRTQSEVATIEYIRLNTSIPVPKIYAFNSDASNNALGLEWILMERIDGRPYRKARRTMTLERKVAVVRQVADWSHQLYSLKFDAIGSLYRQWNPDEPEFLEFKVGPSVSWSFWGPWRHEYKVPRGPFSSLAEYYNALVMTTLAEVQDPRQRDLAREYYIWEKREKAAEQRRREEQLKKNAESKGEDEDSDATTDDDKNQEHCAEGKDPRTIYFKQDSLDYFTGVPAICFNLLELIPKMCRGHQKHEGEVVSEISNSEKSHFKHVSFFSHCVFWKLWREIFNQADTDISCYIGATALFWSMRY